MHGVHVDPLLVPHWTNLYSEHHLRVFLESESKDKSELADPTESELEELSSLAKLLEKSLGITVALSFNRKPHESSDSIPGKKRFLNVRFRGFHSPEPALRWVDSFYEKLSLHSSVWKKGNAIDEWVVFDSFPSMDKKWIDPAQPTLIICSFVEHLEKVKQHARRVGIAIGSFAQLNDQSFVGIILCHKEDTIPEVGTEIPVLYFSDGDVDELFKQLVV